jgi:hypothetical protein
MSLQIVASFVWADLINAIHKTAYYIAYSFFYYFLYIGLLGNKNF